MVVGDDDAGGAVRHGVGEDLARMDGAAINEADGDDSDVDDLVRALICLSIDSNRARIVAHGGGAAMNISAMPR